MTDVEKIKLLSSENTEVALLLDEMGAEPEEKDILGAMQRILDAAKYSGDEDSAAPYLYRFNGSVMREIDSDAEFLGEEFGLSAKQAFLFTVLIDLCKSGCGDVKMVRRILKTDFRWNLTLDQEIAALVKSWLLGLEDGEYTVPKEVINCLTANVAYRKPDSRGMSTRDILDTMHKIFAGAGTFREAPEMVEEIEELLRANPRTSIAKAAMKHEILFDNEDETYMSYMERMVFYVLCYLYDLKDNDECHLWQMRDYFSDKAYQKLVTKYNREEMDLFLEDILEYGCSNGFEDRSWFRIADKVKEEIFADIGGLHTRRPVGGIIKCREITEKPLFFDENTERQVHSLGKLLREDTFQEVTRKLEAGGLRSGFSCLFYGGPGTGKTETVYQIARQTGRDLLMADVSRLKDKWVGESEKNIKALFRKYQRLVSECDIAPILLFNEADAIFGIRMNGAETAVDKMENSIQNIILQEMEDLKGILIATTNLTGNLDKAFERRFLYKIEFSLPSPSAKGKIWRSMMPELSEADASRLAAAYDFSGGQIENILRKKTIECILNDIAPSYETLRRFCDEENIASRRMRIGF